MIQRILILSIFLLVGCSAYDHNPEIQTATIGGIKGAVLGAGTGAIIGALISNGDIGASALLGAGIGLPAGALLSVAYRRYRENKKINAYNDTIAKNYDNILKTQADIEEYRSRVFREANPITPTDEPVGGEYLGNTIGY